MPGRVLVTVRDPAALVEMRVEPTGQLV